MKIGMQQKFGGVDLDELGMKRNPDRRFNFIFDRIDTLFQKGKVKDVEQKHHFLAHLCLEIRKLCMVRIYANIEELLVVAKEVE